MRWEIHSSITKQIFLDKFKYQFYDFNSCHVKVDWMYEWIDR